MLFNMPLSLEKAERLIQVIDLSPADRVLDVGCGQGAFLIRLMEAVGVHGTGVDNDADLIATARQKAAETLAAGTFAFHTADINEMSLPADSFALAICLGATHAFSMGEAAFLQTIRKLKQMVQPGGQLLIGEGYWKQPPAAAYVQLIGDPVGIYRDHATNISLATEEGLVPLYAAVSNEDEWDHFEWSHRLKIERQAAAAPDDPALKTSVARSRQWRDGYLRWGRSTMGFGFYLFMKPGK